MIFVPRILATRRGHISCPKLGALPDCARAQLPPDNRILTVDIDENRRPLSGAMTQLGRKLGANAAVIGTAVRAALAAMHAAHNALPAYDMNLKNAKPGTPRFLVIGHPYNLADDYLSGPVLDYLARLGIVAERVSFATGEIVPEPIKWDTCNVIHHRLRQLEPAAWDGVIQLSSFNCGCDSIVSPLYREILAEKKIPLMTLVLDEHAARAGVETRLEAFVDSIAGRKINP